MGGWDIKIFDCEKNIVMFVWACCVPCGALCMQVLDAKLTDSDKNAPLIAGLLMCCLGCIGGALNRYRLREKLGIEDNALFDILFWWCIPCCAVTQEYITVMEKQKGNKKLLIWEAIKS
jgi:Cys-rich protein (TIGR01571 family)